jgi:hypothetical protein
MRIELDRSVVDSADAGRTAAAISIRALAAHHAIATTRFTRIPCAPSAHRLAVVENTASPSRLSANCRTSCSAGWLRIESCPKSVKEKAG